MLAGIKGSMVIAGHSYGGMVASNAATGNPNVKGLVYIAAFASEQGRVLPLSNKFPSGTLGDTLPSIDLGDGTHDLTIKQDLCRAQFAADCSVVVPRCRTGQGYPAGGAEVHG